MTFLQKKLFIFDYDGTIADTASIHNKAFDLALAGKNLVYNYKEIAGLSTENAFRYILQKNQQNNFENISSLSAKKRKAALTLAENELNLLPGFLSFFNYAKQHYASGIVSSGSKNSVYSGLSKFKILESFEHIICNEHVKNSKPSPEGFLLCIKKFEFFTKSEVLVFEDSFSGFQAAESAGLDFVDINKFGWPKLEKILRLHNEK
ncbi:HAD family hydrolase [Gammaproteobacteria bacterium]|nr:HAD family hydrolase [Gammaproteobacteria bacterium]